MGTIGQREPGCSAVGIASAAIGPIAGAARSRRVDGDAGNIGKVPVEGNTGNPARGLAAKCRDAA